ncbi:AI-2E family transporter [Cerasicoccus arenae]|uniref:AI-2E family transporter n=1 Tax=Cerasicoccus arenae TaxID=424488 RepID=A0A8J3GDU8_9BACT|nr:AI-2E family transporter [Cerasicoccus arenae]MBK1858996.1 AI-2E family transporter [Cerasicoccus arenae]GHB94586.1 AI-2E family transporter [Cerasicoccus arenae]
MTDNDATSNRLLSPNQRSIVGAGLTVLAAVVLLGAVYGLFILLRSFVNTFSDVLLPVALAAILATLLRPLVLFFENRLKLSRVKSILLLFALVMLALFGILSYAAPLLFKQIIDLIDSGPKLVSSAVAFAGEKAPWLKEWINQQTGGESIEAIIKNFVTEHGSTVKNAVDHTLKTLGTAGGLLIGVFAKIAAYAVIPVYLFYLLDSQRDSWKDIDSQLSFINEKWRADILFLIKQFADILVSFFRGQILIGLILSVLFALGFGVIGLKFAILLGIMVGLGNIVPYLGTILGVTVVLPLAYFQPEGGWTLLGLCLGVFAVVQCVQDYVLTPKIMGDKTGMGPMLIIFSIFFWGTALGGILGMILAIPLTAFFLVFWRLAREKYLPKLLSAKEVPN